MRQACFGCTSKMMSRVEHAVELASSQDLAHGPWRMHRRVREGHCRCIGHATHWAWVYAGLAHFAGDFPKGYIVFLVGRGIAGLFGGTGVDMKVEMKAGRQAGGWAGSQAGR